MSCIRGEFVSSPAAIPATHAEATCQTWPARLTVRPALPDQPTRLKPAKFSTKSAAAATLSAGLVIRVASSRARATYCGARIRHRSATSDSRVVVEMRRAVTILQPFPTQGDAIGSHTYA